MHEHRRGRGGELWVTPSLASKLKNLYLCKPRCNQTKKHVCLAVILPSLGSEVTCAPCPFPVSAAIRPDPQSALTKHTTASGVRSLNCTASKLLLLLSGGP
eukprot:4592425-Alexandrium_andersonii.AAC.1